MTTRDGGPAFPSPTVMLPNGNVEWGSSGMSLRDYFAAHASAPFDVDASIGFASDKSGVPAPAATASAAEVHQFWREADAAARYLQADAQIAERAKERP